MKEKKHLVTDTQRLIDTDDKRYYFKKCRDINNTCH